MDANDILTSARKIAEYLLQLGAKGGATLLRLTREKFNIGSGEMFTCPYCMQQYRKEEIQYICPDCGTVTHSEKFSTGSVKCSNPKCGGFASITRCPNCSKLLPQEVLETKNLPFSIVGVISSGKTNYVTVMLEELQKFTAIKLSIRAADKDTRQLQGKNRKTLYDDHTAVAGTAGGSINTQIWVIKNLKKKKLASVPTYTFTIFDGAGENYENNLDPSRPECRNIKASKAVILILDPLILEGVRRKVSDDVRKDSMGGKQIGSKNSSDIVHDMANYIKRASGISPDKRLEIPIAVVLTKIDVIIDDASFQSCATVRAKPMMTDTFGDVNMSEITAVDREIRNWLNYIGEGAFITALEANFKDFRFFGVSSFGSAPDSKHHIADIKPHRVLDPVFWLFKKYGFVD